MATILAQSRPITKVKIFGILTFFEDKGISTADLIGFAAKQDLR
ncbi:MAG: hypothetical protein ACOX5W_02715 [Bacillota bacterium]